MEVIHYATATDDAGNTSSSSLLITIDTTAPDAPTSSV